MRVCLCVGVGVCEYVCVHLCAHLLPASACKNVRDGVELPTPIPPLYVLGQISTVVR